MLSQQDIPMNKSYEDGQKAFADGKTLIDNPYKTNYIVGNVEEFTKTNPNLVAKWTKENANYRNWKKGYIDASKE